MMHKTNILTTLLTLTLCALPALVSAQDYPTSIPVSGSLTDADGKLLDGEHQVTLGFYEDKEGNQTALFEQDFDVTGSLLDVLVKGDVLVQAVQQGKVRYVELTIDGEVMTPRIQLGSVPYALHAQHAKQADNAGNAVTLNNKAADQYVVRDQIAQLFAATLPIKVTQEGTTTKLSLEACASGSVFASTGSSWACKLLSEYTGGDAIDIVRGAAGTFAINVTRGALRDEHIGNLAAINPTKISGTAAVLNSPSPQSFKNNSLVIDQGRVAINKPTPSASVSLDVAGTVAAGTFKGDFQYNAPKTKRVWLPDSSFQVARGDSASSAQWTHHKDGYGYFADPVSTRYIALVAPVPSLPDTAQLSSFRCYYRVTQGSLVNSYAELVRAPWGTLTRTREVLPFVTPAAQFGTASKFLTSVTSIGSNAVAHVHVNWAQSAPAGAYANSALFFGCELEYKTSEP